jgi:hypothetical protein
MKDYAKFLVQKGAPVIRQDGGGDGSEAPVAPRRPRAFDRVSEKIKNARETHGAHVREQAQPRKKRLLSDIQEEAARTNSQGVSDIPDSWDAEDNFRTGLSAPARTPPVEVEPEVARRPGPKRKAKHKTRRTAMSISVSEEEEFILRTYAAKRGMSFSQWSRTVMFRSMGRKIPDRS